MDDDLTFGTSVWGTSDTVSVLPPVTPSSLHIAGESSYPAFDDGLFSDDLDSFATPAESIGAPEEDDDFGDFGDFGEAPVIEGDTFDDADFGGPITASFPWEPIKLDPLPPRSELRQRVYEILGPLWTDDSDALTDEGIREVGGISQVLVTPESRELYKILQQPPSIKASNWTRSRIRRQHLIALGIPVNLDEVLPYVNGKTLPPLEISSRPVSTPPPTRSAAKPIASSSANPSRAGTPQNVPPHFGPKPELDHEKIDLLLSLNTETLNLLPLTTLEQRLNDLRTQTGLASTLLTHLLQTRESLRQDSETYNRLIAELVGEAHRLKSGKSTTRRTTALRR